jgi:hypothetical protein
LQTLHSQIASRVGEKAQLKLWLVKNCNIDRMPAKSFSNRRPCTQSCWSLSVVARHEHGKRVLQFRDSCVRAMCSDCESAKYNFPGLHRPAFAQERLDLREFL